MSKGPIARPTTQHLSHPIKAPHQQHVPQLSALARQSMDQSHPSGDQAHERRSLRHSIAKDQLLVEPREGVGGYRGAVEERVGTVMDAFRNAKRFHATVGFTVDTRLKDAADLGGSRLLLLWDRRN